MKNVDIYTIAACEYCVMAKKFLDARHVAYHEFDVMNDREARERMIALSHQRGVPVIDLGDEVFVGFNRAELEKALGL